MEGIWQREPKGGQCASRGLSREDSPPALRVPGAAAEGPEGETIRGAWCAFKEAVSKMELRGQDCTLGSILEGSSGRDQPQAMASPRGPANPSELWSWDGAPELPHGEAAGPVLVTRLHPPSVTGHGPSGRGTWPFPEATCKGDEGWRLPAHSSWGTKSFLQGIWAAHHWVQSVPWWLRR